MCERERQREGTHVQAKRQLCGVSSLIISPVTDLRLSALYGETLSPTEHLTGPSDWAFKEQLFLSVSIDSKPAESSNRRWEVFGTCTDLSLPLLTTIVG